MHRIYKSTGDSLLGYILVFFAISVSSIVSLSLSSLVFEVCSYLLGLCLCVLLFKREIRSKAVKIFSIVFGAYVLLTLFRYLDIESNWNIFVNGRDETMFWLRSNEGLNKPFSDIIKDDMLEEDVYFREKLYGLYLHALAFCANTYFDGNHIFLQLLGTSLIGAQISIFITGLVYKYSKEHLVSKVLSFMFLTCLLTESFVIHRDVLMMMLYIIVLYTSLCYKWSIPIFLLHVVLSIVAFYIREANGLYLFIIALVNTYLNFGKKTRIIMVTIIVFFVTAIIPYILYLYDTLMLLNDSYEQFDEVYNQAAGLSLYFDILPFPFKQLARTFQGQFQPLPIWADIVYAKTTFGVFMGIIAMSISVFWFRVMCISVRFSFPYYKTIDKPLFVFWVICLIYILLNCMNADPRRMMAMYPVAYLIYLCTKDSVARIKIREFDKFVYGFVAILSMVYIVAKGGFS